MRVEQSVSSLTIYVPSAIFPEQRDSNAEITAAATFPTYTMLRRLSGWTRGNGSPRSAQRIMRGRFPLFPGP